MRLAVNGDSFLFASVFEDLRLANLCTTQDPGLSQFLGYCRSEFTPNGQQQPSLRDGMPVSYLDT